MKSILAQLHALWAREPVLVGTLLPLAAAVQVAVAFGIRSRVSPAGKKN